MNLPPRPGVFCGEVGRVHWLIRSGTAKCPACGAPLFIIPLLLGTVSASAQYSAPYAYRPAPTYSAPAVSYAISDWRRLRQSNGYSFASYANFLVANPGWPGEPTLRRWAEKAMRPGENANLVLAFFAQDKPTTGTGFARLADAYAGSGADERGARGGARRVGFA